MDSYTKAKSDLTYHLLSMIVVSALSNTGNISQLPQENLQRIVTEDLNQIIRKP